MATKKEKCEVVKQHLELGLQALELAHLTGDEKMIKRAKKSVSKSEKFVAKLCEDRDIK